MPPLLVELVPGSSAGAGDSPGVERIPYAGGQTLAQAVYLSGRFDPPALCSGLALCGRCRMRILSAAFLPEPTDEERRLFSNAELAHGWRLACRLLPRPMLTVELPREIRLSGPGPAPPPGPDAAASAGRGAAESLSFALAIDLGTTSLEWALFPLNGAPGESASTPDLWRGKRINPQMGAGSDVLSRLSAARTPETAEALHRLTANALRDITVQGLCRMREIAPESAITHICLAGNPAMTALAFNLDCAGLAAAPYALPERGGRWGELPGLPPLWIPPQLSPFAGGDIAAGYAALALDPAKPPPVYPFLLADMGTNGEFLLALSPGKALAASVALGPALEGTGPRMGSEARPGAVTGFTLRPNGLAAHIPEEEPGRDAERSACASWREKPRGITGTGYIALLHLLLQNGVIDEAGHFRAKAPGPLRNLLPPEVNGQGEHRLRLPHGLCLYAPDIEELLKVKAAFSLGLQRLLAAAGLASRHLRRVYLAGALGRHVNTKALEDLGFFPPGMESRLSVSGNSSLAGARLLLRHPPAREALCAWSENVETVDLASDPLFSEDFAGYMRFCWPTAKAGRIGPN